MDVQKYRDIPYGKIVKSISVTVDEDSKELEKFLKSVPGFDFNKFARDLLIPAMHRAATSLKKDTA